MIQKIKFLPSIIALMLCLTAAAFGQETTGDIEGTITDPAGNVVPGVTVTVSSRGTTDGARPDATSGFNRSVTADDSGFYRMLNVPPGFYAVTTTSVSGFSGATNPSVEVVLGKTTPVNFQLQTGNVSETVTVTSDAIAIDPTDNKIQTNITAQTAELLPKGVNFTSLLQVAGAVRNEPLSGGFQIDGASGSENTFIIDGQDVSNFRTGTLNQNNNIPFQFVQEIQVKSSGFEAEFGGATGGVINVVTKGGSNDFHGETGVTFRPAELQAGPRRFLTNVFPGAPRYFQPQRDNGTDFFPSVTLGGPVVRDRVWFLGSYAPQFRNTNRSLSFRTPATGVVSPGGSGVFNQSDRQEYFFGRLDVAARDNLRMTGSYTWNPRRLRGIVPGFADQLNPGVPTVNFGGNIGTLSGAEFQDQLGGRVNSQNVTGSLTYTPTSKLVVSLRGGYSFLNEKLTGYGVPPASTNTRFNCNSGSPNAPPAEAGCVLGQANFPAGLEQLSFDVSRRRTFDVDASYLVNNFGGRHQFKGGYQFNGISNNVQQESLPQVVFLFGVSISDFAGIVLPETPGNLGSGRLQRFRRAGSAGSDNQTLYFQDSYQPINRLTINAGFRTEREQAPSFIPGQGSINFSFRDKVAPRLGVAFDLTGDGKTKIFGSYGQFFDRFKYELPRGSFGGEFFRRDFFEILPGQGNFQSFTPQRIVGTNPDPFGGTCPITNSTGLTRCQQDFRIPSNAGLGLEFGAIDPDIRPFRQTEFTVGGERDLGGGYLFSTRYTHKNVDEAVEDIGFSSPSGSEAYIIGNPGRGLAAQTATAFGFLPLEAERRYDAFELRLDKRFTKRYYFNGNYTYSRLFGNYSGLASSDENGRTSPNVNRNFDLPFVGFTAAGVPDNGRLPTDRPHVFKFYGAYTVDFNEMFGFGAGNSTEFSGFTTAQSGTPLTSRFTFLSIDNQILNGRGDLGRTERFTQTDIAVRHKYRFGSNERLTMVFDLDVLNLLNESNQLTVFDNVRPAVNLGGSAIGLSANAPTAEAQFQRQNTISAINAALVARIPAINNGITDAQGRDLRFGQTTGFQGPRSVRLGFRLLF